MPLFGPSGGRFGVDFTDAGFFPRYNPQVPNERFFIAVVRVWAGDFVDAIQVDLQSVDTGAVFPLPKNGGGGGREYTISLIRTQTITKVYGKYGLFVDSIGFEVTDVLGGGGKTKYGPFGGTGGDVNYIYERIPTAGRAGLESPILGFFGRAGQYIDAIGVILDRPGFV